MRTNLFFLFLLMALSSCRSQEIYEPLFKCTKKLQDPYGICTHINRKGPRYEFDIRERDLSLVDSIGTTWIRTDWDWKPLKTKNGELNFQDYDSMMLSIRKHHKRVLGIIDVDKDTEVSDNWIKYVEQSALRYKKDVKYWEMLNEVDLRYKFVPGFYSEKYPPFLKEGYLSVKRANKKAKVLFSGFAHIERSEIDTILSQGVGAYFDIMNVHHYTTKGQDPETFLNFFMKLNNIMNKYNISDKQVWLTETGGSTLPGVFDEQTQGLYAPRIVLISFTCGIDKLFWYKTRAREMDPQASVDYYGLVHKDYTPKPAFYSYRTIIKMCPDKSTRPKLKRHGRVYIASWKRPDGKKVYALWTSKEKESVKPSIKGKYNCFDINGREVSVPGNLIEVSPSILYFVGDRKFEMNIEE